MRRIALLNLVIGFFLIFMAACGGAFVALRLTESYLNGVASPGWEAALQASSHGHTSLFGIIHILIGLTMPYSRSSDQIESLKTFGIFCGSMAMGPLLLVRAALGPTSSTEWSGLIVGTCLSLALAAILFHALSLLRRFLQRG
jgi:hypothetical protein